MSGEIKVVDYDEGAESPSVTQIFGGRLMSSEFVPFDDGKEKKSLHKVHIDLILDTRQYMALLDAMETAKQIAVQLVNQ